MFIFIASIELLKQISDTLLIERKVLYLMMCFVSLHGKQRWEKRIKIS